MPPNFVDFSTDNWTHQTWHDDTTMNGFAALRASLAQRLDLGGNSTLGLKASLGARQVSFEARGGEGQYSDDAGPDFRTETVTIDAGDKAISLTGTAALDHMQFDSHLRPEASLPATGTISYTLTSPRVTAGLSLAARPFGWDLTLDTATGVALGVTGLREDSFRNQRVNTRLEPQPIVTLGSTATTELLPGVTAFVKGGLEVRFLTRGSEEDYTLSSGQRLGASDGGAGGFFAKAAVTAGLKGSF